jgi:tetratricopeptide (TPR) repeat protein
MKQSVNSALMAAVCLVAACIIASADPAYTQTVTGPTGAEPPQRAERRTAPPRETTQEPTRKKQSDQRPVLTLESRAKILNDLYDILRQAKDKQTAAPVIAAIKEAWSFSGSPTTDLLLDRAAAAIEAKDAPVALKLIDAAMELQDDFPRAYLMRAMVHVVQGDSRRAIDDLRRTIALDPKNFLPYGMLADEFLKQKMFKESRDATETLLKLCPAAKELYPESDATSRSLDEQGI